MFEIIKKQLFVLSVCFLLSFIICFFYPVKKELYSGIKSFFYSKTLFNINNIVTINYKRTPNNYKEFIVSGLNPILIINLDNKYIENVKIDFKEQLEENLSLKIYIEKESSADDTDNEVIKITDIDPLKENISYSATINTYFKNLILVIGEKIGDSFIIENITYSENCKYYWNKICNYNYRKQIKIKSYWLNVLKLFGLILLFIEYFVVRRYIYKKIGKRK